jgi:alkylresorcinol/alkylpyrone synthase
MFLTGLGISTPTHWYSQTDCWERLKKSGALATLKPRSQSLLRKVLNNPDSGIAGRHLALDPVRALIDLDPDRLHVLFADHAPRLATQAAEAALQEAGLSANDIDAVIVSTCTGYLCPGLSTYVMERLGVRPDAVTLDLVGHGCAAALPTLNTAQALIQAKQAATVLSVCVEVCSAALYLDDDPGVLISACLFGDGAAAVISTAAPPQQGRRIQWMSSSRAVVPEQRDILRFEQRRGMLRNVLSPSVPEVAAEHVRNLITRLLENAQLPHEAIQAWICHTAGRDVLDALERHLSLAENDLRWSRSILRQYGNISSGSVLYALKAARDGKAPPGWWCMASFGAGFSTYAALLSVSEAGE